MHLDRLTPNGKRILTAVTVVVLSHGRLLGAQDSTRSTAFPGYRNPATAQMLGGFIPGAGHIYAGERLRGFGIMVVALSGIATGIASLNDPCQVSLFQPDSCDLNASAGSRALSITQIAVGVGCWVIGAIDAPRAAERENGRLRAARVSIMPASGRAGGLAGIDARLTIPW